MTETAPPPAGEEIRVVLIAKAAADLATACDREGLSRADVVNRAVTLYEFVTGAMAAGREIVVREKATGQTQIMRLL
jgi:hypothetical protein